MILLFVAALVLCLPITVRAEEYDEEVEYELLRQIEEAGLDPLSEYLEDISSFTGEDFESVDKMIFELSERGFSGGVSGVFESIKAVLTTELRKAASPLAALTAAALLTLFSETVSDEGVKHVLSVILGLSSAALCIGSLSVLFNNVYSVINETAELAQRTVPVVSALMIASGSELFSPILLFLSGTVISLIKGIIMPLIIAEGAVSAAGALTDRSGFDGLLKLIGKTVKWLLGLISVVYLGTVSVRGITGSVRNGVLLRSSKYALDKLVPSANGLVSGTVDTVLGCALLIKNGTGIALVMILISRVLRPVFGLLAGMLIFRAAAAISGPLADKRIVKLYGNAADTVSNMFTCAAVSASMLAVTLFVMIASGGSSLGIL